MRFFCLSRVAGKGNPWTIKGPYPDRNIANNWRRYETKVPGRQAAVVKAERITEETIAQFTKSGVLPK